jgi:acid phosphatase family membrane protein YuiD
MQEIIEIIFTDQTFVYVGVLLAILLSLSIFKKLFKSIIVIVIIFFAYSSFVYYSSGKDANQAMKEVFDDIKHLDTKKMKKQLDKSMDDVKKKAEVK